MKKYKLLVLSTVIAAITFSCDDYLDINQSPNAPSSENVTPDLMLAAALNQPFEEMANRANELGNVFMNSWAGDVNNITGAYLDEFALNLTTNFHSDVWDRLYRNTGTLTTISNYPGAKYDHIRAIAMVMKVYYFQTIVDVYGDAPYSQAHLLGGNTTPSYDDDEAIYRDFIIQLDAAINLIATGTTNTVNPGINDIIFGGDMAKWTQFANTMKLRVLLREATKAESNGASATYLNDQFAVLDNNFINENVTMNPGYVVVDNQQNPLWANFGENADGSAPFDAGLIVPTDYAVKFMTGAVTQNGVQTTVNDNRLGRMYDLVGGVVVGVVQGDDNTSAPPTLSHQLIGAANGAGILLSGTQDAFIMTHAESLLLQAEAAARGYTTGTAQSLYDSAITASFTQLGAAGAAAYVTSINTSSVGFTSAANLDEQINAIMTQKWIALMGQNGIESWIEYTRTGYPAIPLATTATQAAKPNRLLYPGSEYTANSANVPTQTAADAFTTHVFWDEN